MNIKINYVLLIAGILAVNAGGFALNYYDFDTYLIFAGFRFHISAIVPLLFILKKEHLLIIKNGFVNPEYKKNLLPLFLIILSLILAAAAFYFIAEAKLTEPKYFYEFGLSSIIDFPIYLIWNFPQLSLLFFFLLMIYTSAKNVFLIYGTLILIFAFEFIPYEGSEINYFPAAALAIGSAVPVLIIHKFRNIYWFAVAIFTMLWVYFLSFGSDSELIVNLLFANQYKSWEGFFTLKKEYADIYLPAYLILFAVVFLSASFFSKKNKST